MTGPPRFLESFLERVLPRGLSQQGTLGDLAEEFAQRRAASPVRAHLWYLAQVGSLLGHRLFGRSPVPRRPPRMDLRTDLRWALRSILRRPGFSFGVVAVLGLGLGSNVAVYSVVDGTLENTSWWADPEASVAIWPGTLFSLGQLETLQREQTVYRAVGGYAEGAVAVEMPDGDSESVNGVVVTPELFRELAVQPVLGRPLSDDDAYVGVERVVVISDSLWRRSFGADPGIVGSRITIAGAPITVVGVQAPGGAAPGGRSDVWMPLVMDPRDDDYWKEYAYTLVAVLRDGATLIDADTDLKTFTDGLAATYPMFFPEDWAVGARVTVADDAQRRLVTTPLSLLLAGTALLLLVTALNVGNLLLGRAIERKPEFTVRVSLGAGRARIVAQLLVEGLVLTTLALLVGVAWASYASRWIARLFVNEPVVGYSSVLSPGVIGFSLAVAALAWVVLNGVPIGYFLRTHDAGLAAARDPGNGLRRGLVVVQAAMATLLLVSAGLLVATVDNLRNVPLGFDPRGVVTVELSPPADRVATPVAARDLYERLAEATGNIPGVRSVGLTGWLPLRSQAPVTPVNLEEAPVDPREAPKVPKHHVDAGFFGTLGIEPLEGRLLGAEERGVVAPTAVVVNATLAQQLWPGQSPIGKRVAIDPHAWDDWVPVVGVVPDVRSGAITGPIGPALYVSLAESPARDATLVVRTAQQGSVVAALRGAVAGVDPLVPIRSVTDMSAVVRGAYATAWVMMGLLTVLAALASVLGALGVNAVLMHHVALNRKELAVRMALGARPGEVAGGVVRSGMLLAGIGVVIGCGVAAITTRVLESLLFEVSTLAPAAFLTPAALLVLAAAAAAWAPAARAGRLQPADVLRSE